MEDESAHAPKTRYIQSKVSILLGHLLDYDTPVVADYNGQLKDASLPRLAPQSSGELCVRCFLSLIALAGF